jgi:hypothetical protein
MSFTPRTKPAIMHTYHPTTALSTLFNFSTWYLVTCTGKAPGTCCPAWRHSLCLPLHTDSSYAQHTTWNAHGIAVLHESRRTNSTTQMKALVKFPQHCVGAPRNLDNSRQLTAQLPQGTHAGESPTAHSKQQGTTSLCSLRQFFLWRQAMKV